MWRSANKGFASGQTRVATPSGLPFFFSLPPLHFHHSGLKPSPHPLPQVEDVDGPVVMGDEDKRSGHDRFAEAVV